MITLGAGGAARLLQHRQLWNRPAANVLSLALASTLAVMTWIQSHVYANPESLYRATIQGNPKSWMAHNNLAGLLIARGKMDEAAGHIQTALAL